MSRITTLIKKARFSRSQEKALLAIHGNAEQPLGVQAISGPGAINLTTYLTQITTTGADAFTLADGVLGQRKRVEFVVDGGDATITPANLNEGTTVVMSLVGDIVEFEMRADGWQVVHMDSALGTGVTPVFS